MNEETLNIIRKLLFDVSSFAVWLPLLIGLLGIKKASPAIWVLLAHLFIAAVIQAYAYYLWKNGKNNLFLLHIYTVEEFSLLTFFYCLLLRHRLNKYLFIVFIPVFLICAVLNARYFQPVTGHNTYVRSLESLLIIVWCIIFFYTDLTTESGPSEGQNGGLLVINSGFLIYFSASLLLFTLSNFISAKSSRNLRVNLWAVHAFFSIMLNLLIAYGLWKHQKMQISSSSS